MKLWLVLWSVLAIDDAGTDAGADAGTDGGREAPKHWVWTHASGEWLNDAGVTDVVTMRVGEVAELKLALPIVLMQCDAQLLTLDATKDTLLLKAVKAGNTRCGFWYRRNAWPHRTLELHVE